MQVLGIDEISDDAKQLRKQTMLLKDLLSSAMEKKRIFKTGSKQRSTEQGSQFTQTLGGGSFGVNTLALGLGEAESQQV